MKIGIGDYYLKKYGLDEGALRMAKDGYEYIDLSFSDCDSEFYTSTEDDFFMLAGRYRAALKKQGISVWQIHGPWRFPPNDGDDDSRAELFGKMTKALGIARFFGAKYMAVHPLMPFGEHSPDRPDEVYEINKRFFSALASVAGRLGVTVCLENMPFVEFPLSGSDKILELLRDINSPYLKLCFDTGHANMLGEPIDGAVRDAGVEMLKIVHIHDNMGDRDSHLPPYDGNIDWGRAIEALYDIGFDGVISLECSPVRCEDDSATSEEQIREKEKEVASVAKLLAGI